MYMSDVSIDTLAAVHHILTNLQKSLLNIKNFSYNVQLVVNVIKYIKLVKNEGSQNSKHRISNISN